MRNRRVHTPSLTRTSARMMGMLPAFTLMSKKTPWRSTTTMRFPLHLPPNHPNAPAQQAPHHPTTSCVDPLHPLRPSPNPNQKHPQNPHRKAALAQRLSSAARSLRRSCPRRPPRRQCTSGRSRRSANRADASRSRLSRGRRRKETCCLRRRVSAACGVRLVRRRCARVRERRGRFGRL